MLYEVITNNKPNRATKKERVRKSGALSFYERDRLCFRGFRFFPLSTGLAAAGARCFPHELAKALHEMTLGTELVECGDLRDGIAAVADVVFGFLHALSQNVGMNRFV